MILIIILALLELTSCEGKSHHNKTRHQSAGQHAWNDVVIIPKDYSGDVPPTMGNNATAVDVSIQLEILRDLMVDEMQGEITIDCFLTTRWRDSRLKVNERAFNATEIDGKVILSPRMDKRIWKPDIVFVPMEELVLTRGMKPVKLLAISSNETLTYKIGYSHRFVNLTWGAQPLRFRAAQGRVTQMKQPQFGMRFIPGSDKDEFSEHKANMLMLTVLLHRDIRSHILVTYFPSALFVSVSWGSFLVNPEAVPGRMVLLVTTLLTLVTMLNTVRCGTPPTADIPQTTVKFKQTTPESEEIKPVEVWIVTCIGFVVLALFEYFVVLYVLRCRTTWHPIQDGDTENGQAHRPWLPYCLRTKPGAFDMLSFIIFPSFFLFFNIIYWINCLTEMDKHFQKVGLNRDYSIE